MLDPQLVSKTEAEPFEVEDESFFLTIMEDECSHKQRLDLERTFFHDLLNTAGGMQGLTGILQEATEEELPELKDSVQNMADQLVEEILSQRDLLAAELGELNAQLRRVNSSDITGKVIKTYRSHSSTGFRQIDLSPQARHFYFKTDPILLGRVLGNMIKNALEACKDPSTVTVNCGEINGEAWFSVHNPGFIPESDHPRVFQQSYSTKGRGRGTGTFSMKLFTEKYLGGRIRFESNAAAGTTFTVELPTDGL